MSALLSLALAHARRRPWRFLLAAAGMAVAVGFALTVIGEATISGDQAARDSLAQSSVLERTVRLTWTNPVTPAVEHQARRLLARLGTPATSEAVLVSPIRLSGSLVRLAAVAPLTRWSSGGPLLGACYTADCPMLLAGGRLSSSTLTAAGIRISVTGTAQLRAAVPLGLPAAGGGPALLVSGDVGGLERLPALSAQFRVHSWASALPLGRVDSWDIPPIERALQRAQVTLTGAGSGFSLTAPFDTLAAARARADAAPKRLLLTGGGALAALAVFVVLAGGAMRREHRAELARLQVAGARTGQAGALTLLEAGWVAGVALLAGAVLGVAACSILAASAGLPKAVLDHALLRPLTAVGIPVAWLLGTAGLAVVAASPSRLLVALADLLGLSALAGIAVALALGTGHGALALLLAPLVCLAGGVLLLRGATLVLRLGGRFGRGAPPLVRVASLGLARGPGLSSLSIAFIAISIGIGGFALCFRATLERNVSDQAADRVPLDATVTPGVDFATPLEVAPLSRWRALAGGAVLPVRRTDASYPSGGATATVPALGVPTGGLTMMRGWRVSDGSQPLPELARRLVPPGPVRRSGPELPAGAHWLAVRAESPELGVDVTADLRLPDGSVQRLPLGEALPKQATLRAALPPGRFELEALQLAVPSGTEATAGHQNAENPVAQPQLVTALRLGAPVALDRRGDTLAVLPTAGWRGVGAARVVGADGAGVVARFAATSSVGVLRPPQPSDTRPLAVVVDPATAAASGPAGELPLTIDGLPVRAHVVGVVRRFPTLPGNAEGFVVADTSQLGAALDAQAPGQGMANELWLSAPRPRRLEAALAAAPLAQLTSTFRRDVERTLRNDPTARAVMGTLLAAAALTLVLAMVGALAAASDSSTDAGFRRDLAGIGLGPRGLRRELRLRLLLAAGMGVLAGAALTVLLTVLAVPALRGVLGSVRPPAVTVLPAAALALWLVGSLAALALSGWLASERAT